VSEKKDTKRTRISFRGLWPFIDKKLAQAPPVDPIDWLLISVLPTVSPLQLRLG